MSTSAPGTSAQPAYAQLSVEEVLSHNNEVASTFQRNRLCISAAKSWDRFYGNNASNFFKDRHWTLGEFFEDSQFNLDEQHISIVVEVGCGTGSFVYPLLEQRPDLYFHACDFSKKAVEQVKKHPDYTPQKVHAFVYDITSPARLAERLSEAEFSPEPSVSSTAADLLSCIFVLGAIPPDKQAVAMTGLLETVRVGGFFIFRDYALHDAAQLRLHFRKSHGYSDPSLLDKEKPFYCRSDQTLTYFFTPEELISMVESEPTSEQYQGMRFERLQCEVVERDLGNRKEGWEVKRKFVQGVWKRLQ